MVRRVYYKALAQRVLAVAVVRIYDGFKDWRAFIDAVAGDDHESEKDAVLAHGDQLSFSIAKILFPSLSDYNWRD